jgi:hypothetical protein
MPGRGEPAADLRPVGRAERDLLHRSRRAHRRPGREVRQEQQPILGEVGGRRHAEHDDHDEQQPAHHAPSPRPRTGSGHSSCIR